MTKSELLRLRDLLFRFKSWTDALDAEMLLALSKDASMTKLYEDQMDNRKKLDDVIGWISVKLIADKLK